MLVGVITVAPTAKLPGTLDSVIAVSPMLIIAAVVSVTFDVEHEAKRVLRFPHRNW